MDVSGRIPRWVVFMWTYMRSAGNVEKAFEDLRLTLREYYELRIERLMQRAGRTDDERYKDAVLMERLFHEKPVLEGENKVPEVWMISGLLSLEGGVYRPVCPAAREVILEYGREHSHMLSLISVLVCVR